MDIPEWYAKTLIDDLYKRNFCYDVPYRYNSDIITLSIDGKVLFAYSERIDKPEQKALGSGD